MPCAPPTGMHIAVSSAKAVADRIGTIRTAPELERAGAEFAHALKMVSSDGAGFAHTDFGALQTMADRVIECIEEHLATHRDRASVQQALVELIYRIRRRIEAIDFWQRHCDAALPAKSTEVAS